MKLSRPLHLGLVLLLFFLTSREGAAVNGVAKSAEVMYLAEVTDGLLDFSAL